MRGGLGSRARGPSRALHIGPLRTRRGADRTRNSNSGGSRSACRSNRKCSISCFISSTTAGASSARRIGRPGLGRADRFPSTLTSRINAARAAIGDDEVEQWLIRTVARRGYCFVSDVVATGAQTATERRPRGPRQSIGFCVASDGARCLRRRGPRSDDRESRRLPLAMFAYRPRLVSGGEWIKSAPCAGDKPLTLSQRGGRLPDSGHGPHRA